MPRTPALYDPLANRLIVFGGSVFNPVTGIGNSFYETWVLENANGIGGSPNWVQVTPTGGPPPGRFGHSAGYSPASGRMVVAMGRGNSDVLLDDAWVLAFKRVARLLDREASPSTLWPPNHRFRLATLSGATDPDGDPVTLTITGVTQDEPVSGLGGGDLSPDAQAGTQSNNVSVRSERSDTGDGRVYRISFTGSDGQGRHLLRCRHGRSPA